MSEDISRQTIFVLVVLTLLISVLGTWTVLSHVEAGYYPPPENQHDGAGKVMLNIEGNIPVEPDLVTGQVVFEIKKP